MTGKFLALGKDNIAPKIYLKTGRRYNSSLMLNGLLTISGYYCS